MHAHRFGEACAWVADPGQSSGLLSRGFRCERGRGETDGVLRLSGPVDRESAEQLRTALAQVSWDDGRPLTVELGEAELLSSAAVQALYDARASGPVELVAALGSPAQHVLDLVGLPYEQSAGQA